MSVDPEAKQAADDHAIAAGFALAGRTDAANVVASRDGSGTLVVDVPLVAWVAAAAHARDALDMDFLDWLSAVDAPDDDPAGVDVVLHVAATNSAGAEGDRARYLRHGNGGAYVQRLLLRTHVPDGQPLPSLTSLWPGVAWHERETFEMFGVAITGFDDGTGQPVRPLLLPEGFEGTPLRKSFVLAARAAKAWPGAKDPADSQSPARPARADTAGSPRPARPDAAGSPRPARAGGASGRPGGKAPSRRKTLPPGVPDPEWGPRYASSGSGDASGTTDDA